MGKAGIADGHAAGVGRQIVHVAEHGPGLLGKVIAVTGHELGRVGQHVLKVVLVEPLLVVAVAAGGQDDGLGHQLGAVGQLHAHNSFAVHDDVGHLGVE